MVYTRSWNSAYEALPPDSGEAASIGASRIRHAKQDIRERMAKDHYFDIAGTDADHGEHVKATFRTGSAPTQATDKIIVYGKDVSGKCELFAIDEDGDEVQLTSGGRAYGEFPTSTPILMYRDTAPTGWTIDNTLDDKAVMVTKGSVAGGETGGGAHSAGTWTQPTHTHTGPSHTHTGPAHTHTIAAHAHTIPTHTHVVPATSTIWGDQSGNYEALGVSSASQTRSASNNASTLGSGTLTASTEAEATSSSSGTGTTGAEGTGATGSSATANTWRPAAYCFIIASKN